jgi:NAD(P)-dependent dehydrogenase (short-subunit alcohol dehydrogenase family)
MGETLKDKVALITGASSGIGEATARLFIDEGAKVGALARTREELHRAVDKMTQDGGQAIALQADISKPAQMQGAVEELMSTWGRLDIVFANAGINGVWAPIEELSAEEWRHTIDINLNGTFYTLKYAVPHMKERGGSIIVTASINGTRTFSNSGASAYATSKAGQVALTKMLALELARYEIRVNVICPGAIDTQIEENTERQALSGTGWPAKYPKGPVPLRDGKPGQPEQVARLALFLASEDAALITGTPVWIDGAESLLQG